MKFFVHKLGCPKNDVDADYISARLIADGHEPVATAEEADSIIVNTCGFILPAKEESIAEIFRLGLLKKEGKLKYLYASGCLSQRYGTELLSEIPELDGTFGLGAMDSLAATMSDGERPAQVHRTEAGRLSYIAAEKRFIADNLPYAYIKISDGCDRLCSFCAIPAIRGQYRSRPLEPILNEARFLASHGKRELILVSQEATLYGHDLRDGSNLLKLLQDLESIEEVRWIRLMYLYPTQLSEQLIDYIVSPDNKTLNYFDLPLQHISEEILASMKRRMNRERIESVLRMIRSKSRDATIRTTFIVGFPGESQRHFAELREFIESFQFDRLGVFTYSPEEGTPSTDYDRKVPEKKKTARLDELMSLQRDIALAKNNSLIGTTKEVIIDAVPDNGAATGRTRADCPEIDQEVFVTGEGIEIGDICRVRIDGVDGYDLVGTKVKG